MISATICNEFGTILSSMKGSETDINLFTTDADFFIEGYYTESEYYIDIETKTAVLKPERPNTSYSWNEISKQWSPNKNISDNRIREFRNALLIKSDWTQMPDVSLSLEQKEAWQIYRQVLRDITDTQPNAIGPEEVVWPTPPV